MRLRFGTILAAGCAIGEAAFLSLPATARADDTPLAESAAITYAADTRPSPRAVKTAAELAELANGTWAVTRRDGETMSLTSPSGTSSALTSSTLNLDAGGVWTVTNSKQGAATFTVRRSLDGTLGDGTAASPAKLVDGDELRDYGADENYTFTLDGADGLLSRLVLPVGYRLEEAGESVWRIVASADGSQYAWAEIVYPADTRPSPRAVKTAAEQTELANGTWAVTRRDGETVSLTSPSGNTAALAGLALNLNAGGVWTVVNSRQGAATFTVRRSLDGMLGDGTAASPAKLVDGDELRDYGADENYTFTLDGADGLLSRLVLPVGYRLEEAGEGVWRIVASADGSQYAWAEIVYPADSAREGPDRKTSRKGALPVAYSGDNWLGDAAKAATVVFTSPNGTATTLDLAGTGTTQFTFDSTGKWTVTLTMADGTTRTAMLYMSGGLTIIIK